MRRLIGSSGALLSLALLMQTPSSAMQLPKSISAKSLYGEWVSECVPLGQNGRHGLVARLNITSNRLEMSGQMYGRNSCQGPVLASNLAAELRGVRGGPEQLQLDLKVISGVMTINDDGVVALSNQDAGRCGLKGWQRDVPMHVEGRACDPIAPPAKGARVVQDATIAGDQLTLNKLDLFFSKAEPPPGVILPATMKFHRKGV